MSSIQVPDNNIAIATLSRKVTAALSALSNKVTEHSNEHSKTEPHFTVEDEIERFEIWRVEQGVDHGKLDHRLREAVSLRERVIKLLEALCELSFEATSDSKLKTEDHAPTHLEHDSRNVELRSPISVVHGDEVGIEEEDGSSSIDTDVSFPDSVPETAAARAHDIITLLMELGRSLLDPTPQNKLSRLSHPDAGDFDRKHVSEKFPEADEYLVRQFGQANWDRRQYFRSLRYEEENIPAFSYEITNFEDQTNVSDLSDSESVQSEQLLEDGTSLQIPTPLDDSRRTSASTPSEEVSSFQDDTQSSLRRTRSTSLTELSDEHSVGVRALKDSLKKYRIPPPPGPQRGLSGEGFRCTYCAHFLLNVRTNQEWKSHVLDDIKPYMCTYEHCPLTGKTYGTRKAWWYHEKQRHRTKRIWKCQPCESEGKDSVFQTILLFNQHMASRHLSLSRAQIQNIRGLCQQDDGVLPPHSTCPLCKTEIPHRGDTGSPSHERAVRRHMADHMEQLAYFVAFPAGDSGTRDDDSVFQDDSDSEEDFKSEIRSVASKDTHLSMKNINAAFVEGFISSLPEPGKTPEAGTTGDLSKVVNKGAESSRHTTSNIQRKPVTFPIRLIVHPENEHFYARQDLLRETEKILSQSGSICIFQGVGGVGKTLAAVQYVYTNQVDFDAIFWLQADTAPGRSDSYFQLAFALELADGSEEHVQVMERARTWLESTDKRWLLIFDNASKWSDIAEYLPNELQQTNGSVLITTQTQDFLRPSKNVTNMRLNTLSSDAGCDMLLRYLDRDVKTDPERHLAKEISIFLGGLPVAIAHAAGYIGYSNYTLEELIETFQEWRKRAGVATDEADDLPASFREAAVGYDDTLAMVWNITLRELSSDCTDVMNLLSYLNCEAIPERIIWGVHQDPILDFLDSREKVRHRRIKQSLIQRRLLQTKTVDGELCFSMHRSLQRGIREGISASPATQQKIFDQAIALIREVFPRSNPLQQPTPNQWLECQRLLPHLHALRDVYYRSFPDISGPIDFAQLLTDAGMDQFERGITKEGLLLLKTAEDVLQAGSPEDHQIMLADIHAMIAILYDNTGITQRQEAFDRRKTALAIRKKVFEQATTPQRKDEILLYNSEMEYAMALLHYHRFQEAEPIIVRCLEKFREWGSEADIPFEYAKYYNKMALVRMYQGRFEEAIELAARGMELMEKTGYMLFASRFKFDLACIILQSGDIDRALQVHKEILAQRIEDLGQANELTLHSIYAIGAIHELNGNLDDAERMFRRAVEQRRALTSWPEEAFSRAQFHLSKVLQAKGRPEDTGMTKVLRERSLRTLHRLLPLDNPPELEGVTDEAILFDHLLPINPGGTRFTGRNLLPYFMKKG